MRPDLRSAPGRALRGLLLAGLAALAACDEPPATLPDGAPAPKPAGKAPAGPPPPWASPPALAPGQTFALRPEGARAEAIADARAAGLLDVDLSDEWAPFIFSEHDGPDGPDVVKKPQFYRKTFVDLANDRLDPDELLLSGAGMTRGIDLSPEAEAKRKEDEERRKKRRAKGLPDEEEKPRRKRTEPIRNFLEPFGIPPSLSVLLARIEEDAGRPCLATLDPAPLAAFAAANGMVTYQTRERAKKDLDEAHADALWIAKQLASGSDAGSAAAPRPDAGPTDAALAALAADPKAAARVDRYRKGQTRLRAVRAAQARLVCEGLLSPKSKYTDGMFDLATHEALALWERKNDIFGWGFLGEETLAALGRPALALHLETFRRILLERMADAAAVIEDGSVSTGKRPATYKDEAGETHPVPNLLGAHVDALMGALRIATPEDLAGFLRSFGRERLAGLHVAFSPPPRPPYYAPDANGELDLEVEIDRGDIWYDFPWDAKGNEIEQRRDRFPHLTLLVRWNKQRIPLARWRTTIGSWRSEAHANGKLYFKYKNSDVGPRIWKHVVAAPVWVPPEGTPAKDLLTKKIFDRNVGPQTVVNTDVMGPGFQSAYGLVLAIHHEVTRGGGLFDNQIRTHGSVDYTSIARRFSHGCHRLVNSRAVRLFGFVLRHRKFDRLGSSALNVKRYFSVEGQRYGYEMATRGYYYQIKRPVPVNVLEGRVVGKVKKPIVAYVRKPGVDYSDVEPAPTDAPPATATATPGEAPPVIPVPVPVPPATETGVDLAPSVGP